MAGRLTARRAYHSLAERGLSPILVGGGAVRARLGVETLDLDFLLSPEEYGVAFRAFPAAVAPPRPEQFFPARVGGHVVDIVSSAHHGGVGFYNHVRRRSRRVKGVPTAAIPDVFYMRLNIPAWREWTAPMGRDMAMLRKRGGRGGLERALQETKRTASRFGRASVVAKRLEAIRRICGL